MKVKKTSMKKLAAAKDSKTPKVTPAKPPLEPENQEGEEEEKEKFDDDPEQHFEVETEEVKDRSKFNKFQKMLANNQLPKYIVVSSTGKSRA